MDQKAWCFLRRMSVIGRPLVKNKDNQVAKQRGHEDYFRNKSKVDIQGLPEITKKREKMCKVIRLRVTPTPGRILTRFSPTAPSTFHHLKEQEPEAPEVTETSSITVTFKLLDPGQLQ